MNSMTGYGRGEALRDGVKVTVEVSSVNRKSAELNLITPRELDPLEAQIRDEVLRQVSRGRLTVRVTLHAAEGGAGGKAKINAALARAYAREFRKLGRELKLEGDLSLDTLLRAPGVIEAGGEELDAEAFWPAVKSALGEAMSGLQQMRQREGGHLAKDLAKRITAMRKAAGRVRARAPGVLARYREQLVSRLAGAGIEGVSPDDERLAREIVLFADRSDITEELTRLDSHFQQFADCTDAKEAVGRKLDFLSQEMNREFNTIGSKAQDSEISRDVITLKTELEKFREQVQNVE